MITGTIKSQVDRILDVHYEGLDGIFGDSEANAIVELVLDINERAAA